MKNPSNDRIKPSGEPDGTKTGGALPPPYSDRIESIGTRILARYYEAADTVFMDGSTPWEIDEPMVEFGFDMGPFEAQDVSGLDTSHAMRQYYLSQRPPGRRKIPLLNRMMELGKLGKKSGAGWYRYPGGGGKVEDPIVADLAIEESYFEKRDRTDYSAIEIRYRLLLAMINEACDALHEGFANSAENIDLAAKQTCGFPSSKGSLMQYADQLGAKQIVAGLSVLAKEDSIAWHVSPLLENYAANGSKLTEINCRNW